jgi:4-hydroxy-tetrahydrodipicolinate synthase
MLQVEQLAEICEGAGIKAIKEASGDLAFFARSQMRTKGTFLSGDDPTYLASLAVGGKGVISVAANIFPRAFVALTNAFFHGDIERSQAIFQTLLPAIDALFCEINPCPLKSALASLHLCKNVLRLPLVPISEANATHVAAVIRATQDTLKRILADA